MDQEDRERISAIEARLKKGDERMGAIETELAENTTVTKEIKDMLDMARAGLKVLGGIGSAAKWLGALAAAIVAIWTFIHTIKNGGPPPK